MATNAGVEAVDIGIGYVEMVVVVAGGVGWWLLARRGRQVG